MDRPVAPKPGVLSIGAWLAAEDLPIPGGNSPSHPQFTGTVAPGAYFDSMRGPGRLRRRFCRIRRSSKNLVACGADDAQLSSAPQGGRPACHAGIPTGIPAGIPRRTSARMPTWQPGRPLYGSIPIIGREGIRGGSCAAVHQWHCALGRPGPAIPTPGFPCERAAGEEWTGAADGPGSYPVLLTDTRP